MPAFFFPYAGHPSLADLPDQRAGELASEAYCTERGELEREQPLSLGTVEAVERGKDLVEATGWKG